MEILNQFNQVEELKPQFNIAYPDIPDAHHECKAVGAFFKKHYNIADPDIITL